MGPKTNVERTAIGNKKRAVIYARYSTDLQNEISIDDQIRLCRRHAEHDESIVVVSDYCDKAKSGTDTVHREGLNKLLTAAKRREFDIVIVESLDRLSRDLGDMAHLFEDLRYWEIEIRTVNEGIANKMLVALRGLMGEIFVKDVGDKVNRAQSARVEKDGKIPGALSYGYKLIADKPGEREIDLEQAKIVRRIFQEYASGTSPRAIAEGLNKEGVMSPAGKRWTHQAIGNGAQAYGKGIIHNRLYLGEIYWNRCRNVKNRVTKNRERRLRDQKDWIVRSAPHFRIVSNELWDAVHKIRAERSQKQRAAGHSRIVPRAKSLFAGLLRCGACGADMRISTGVGDLRRVVCSVADKNRLDCQHGRSYDLKTIEHEAIRFVRDCFADPKRIAHFVRTFETEYAAEQKRAKGESHKVEKRLLELEGAIRRLVNALEIGSMPESVIHGRLRSLEAERVSLNERRQLADSTIAKVSLHPAAIKRWHSDLCFLAERAQAGDLAESPIALRGLLTGITVHPTAKKRPYQIEPMLRLGALSSQEPKHRTPAQIASEHGVTFSDNGKSEVPDLPVSKNDKAAISLGILTAGKASDAA